MMSVFRQLSTSIPRALRGLRAFGSARIGSARRSVVAFIMIAAVLAGALVWRQASAAKTSATVNAATDRTKPSAAKFSFSIFKIINSGAPVDPTISGTVYTTGGAVPMGSGRTITLLQNGVVAGSGVTNGSGDYSISILAGTLLDGDKLAVYIDDATEKGATVTLSGISDINNLNIWQNALIVRTDNLGTITNTDLGGARNADTDFDPIYSVAGAALTVPNAVALQIWSGSNYAPGGTDTVGGDWTNNGSSFTAAGNLVNFNGSSGQLISGSLATAFDPVSMNGSSQITLGQDISDTTLTIGGTNVFDQGASFSITTGAVSVASGTTWRNLGTGDLTITSNGGGTISNSGTIEFNANGPTCGQADSILIRSSATGTQRTWSGTGTFSMTDVDVQDQTTGLTTIILVNSGTGATGANNGTGWKFVDTCTAGTYTWIGGASQDWTVPTNWQPTRTDAALATTSDTLIFDGNVTPAPIVTNVPSQSMTKLHLQNGVFGVTLKASTGSTSTLTINGGSAGDFDIPSGNLLTLDTAGSTAIQIDVTSNSTATIAGQINFVGAAHRLTGSGASSITFTGLNGFATGAGFTGNPFGAGVDGSVVFASGSTASFNAGGDPFGGDTHAVAVFNSGSTASFNAQSALSCSNDGSSAGRSYGNLILDNNIGGDSTYACSGSHALTILNDLTIQNNRTFALSGTAGGNLNLQGNFTNNNAAVSSFDPNGRTVTFNGAAAIQTRSKASGASETFGDVVISKTGGSVQNLSGLIITGTLQFGGTIDVLDLNGVPLTLNGSISDPGPAGAFKGSDASVFTIGGSGALGASLKFVSGSEAVNSLIVARTSSTIVLANNLTIGNLTTGALTLTDGIVDAGSNTISLLAPTTTSRTNGYVIGALQKSFGASGNLGSFIFPVGTANGSSQLDANVTANNSGTLTVKAVEGKQPNISGTNALQRYWILSGSGLTTNLTFHYNASDVVGTEALYKIFKYNGSFTQVPLQSIDTSAHTATATGVSSFSDWTLAEPTAVQPGTLQFVGAPYTDSETDTTHPKTITVSRAGGSDGALDVTYTTSAGTATAGSDYVETTGTLHWDDAETGTKTFNITVNGDTTYEANETVNITLSNPTDGATITPPNPTTLTITNDDPVPADATLVVNTTDDNDFGACVTEHCSLREAINAANSLPDTNTINFNIPGGGVRTITLGAALPTITRPANLNGYSQPLATANTLAVGDDANLLIELDGTSAGAGAIGLEFGATASSSSVRGLIINRFTLDGVRLTANSGCVVAGNFIGTNAAGTAASGNLHGVFVNGANNSTIGGTTAADRNIISGSKPGGNQGVQIAGTVTGNVVKGNYIGTNAAGTAAVPNSGDGIRVVNTLIGGTTALEANVIAGNTLSGISINGDGTIVKGNFIGANSAGAVLGNGDAGIQIVSANNSVIGGAAAGEPNTIANSGNAGVFVQSGTGNAIRANSIHDNGGLGIDLGTGGLTTNDTGDPDTGANNLQNFPVITSSKVTGPTKTIKGTLNSIASQSFTIEFFANATCDGSGNGEGSTYLGSTPVTTDGSGNGSFTFHPGTLAVGDVITATATDSGNNTSEFSACFTTIAGTPGTLQFSASNTNDTELNSSTHPVTITATRTGGLDGDVSVHYATSDGTATAGSDYDTASGDFTWLEGDGAPKTFDVTIHGDTTYEANETIILTLSNAQVASLGSPSTATITIINDDTPPATLTVNTTDDNDFTACLVAHCSLREAINAANFNVDTNTINFDIPISDPNHDGTSGVFTISPGSALPTITSPVTIDGYTQTPCATNSAPCSKENTLTVGSDAVLLIEINGANAGGYGLRMSASNSTIKGLVINRSTQSEIEITGSSDVVRGNFLGSDASGTADLGNTVRAGIEINGTNGNTIGGSSAAERNVISGGNGWGIFLINGGSGNTVRNNYIGTDKSGTADLGNTNDGVLIDNRTNNSILGNLISGNDANGILIRNNAAGGTANVVRGNLIGTKADGATALGNGGHGVKDQRTTAGSSDGNTIGGTGAGEANTIAFNGGAGVFVDSSDPAFITGTSIRGNSIYSNTGLGIDLAPTGVTPNDAKDPDTGANNLQNFPIIAQALVGGTNTIRGTLNSTPGQTFTIDVYDSPACNASGKVYLGSTTTTTTDGNGDSSFSFVTTSVTAGDYITATATDSAGNTSEFSACALARTYAAGTIGFAQANTDSLEGDSSTHTVDITVTRTGGSDGAASVNYSVTDGTATIADNDYSVSSPTGTFNWADGNSDPKTITITVKGDTKFELHETVNLTLSSVTGLLVATGTSAATLTIKNDDTEPKISINDVTANEGDSGTTNFVFTVSLSNASYLPITVDYATADDTATAPSDYTAIATTPLTFNPDETSQPVTVVVKGDNTFETNEQFFVNLTNASNATFADDQGLGTITNDDPTPTITINDVSQSEGDGPGTTGFTFTVSLSNPSYLPITVDYATADGTASSLSDYTAIGTTQLTFDPGDTSKPVTVQVSGDFSFENNETFFVNLSNAANATIGDAQGVGTIVNDDTPPTLTITDRTTNEGTSPGTTTPFTFTVTRSVSEATSTVNFATAPGSTNPATAGAACGPGVDYITQSGTLTFPTSGPGSTTQTITVLVCKDTDYEANEQFVVNLSGATNATIDDDQGVGTILNDDVPSAGFSVNNTGDADDGACTAIGIGNGCSLREAINATNSAVTAVAIKFAIPVTDLRHFYYKDDGVANQVTNDPSHLGVTSTDDTTLPADIDPDWPHSWWSILPASQLPAISKQVFVDGYSQTGATVNTLTAGDNAVLRIELDGASSGLVVQGLSLTAGVSTVRGLVINRFKADAGDPTPTGVGLRVQSTSDSVLGNFIGTDVSGTLDLGNEGSGLFAPGSNATIGGATPDVFNLISGNDVDGILFSNSNSNVIQGNLIGTKANGTSALGNGGNGISFTGGGSGFNSIGGIGVGEGNTIAFNGLTGGDGVRVDATAISGNAIRGNSIFSNGSGVNDLGIDLGADGLTANDLKDPDSGPNGQQNFPVITSVLVTGSTRTITGTLNSTPGDTFTIDFYQSPSCDASGNGEGKTYLGSTAVTTDGTTGDGSFTFHPAVLTIGQVVTATATTTGASFNTSEFSACSAVTDGSPGAGDIQFTSATYSVAENVGGLHQAAITLTRVGGTNGSISSTFTTSNGTATAGADYNDASGTVTFGEGETSKTINVTINDDSIYEGDETVLLSLGTSTINAAQPDGSLTPAGDPHAAVLTILENDPKPTFAITPSVTHAEGDTGTTSYVFTVTKTGSTAINATVDYATVNGTATAPSDYTAVGAALTFLPGDTTKQITVLVNGDTTVEPDEAFTVHLSNPGNATISAADGTGAITNDDTDVTVAVSPASVAEDGAANLVYTFTRTGVAGGALTVNFSVGGTATFGTDYAQSGAAPFSASSGTVTIGAGNSTATVTIDPTPDITFEANETVILTVTSGTGYNAGSPSAATGTINNDDAAGGIIQFTANTYNTTENSRSVTITVERLGSTSGAVTVNYATPDDSEATTVTPCGTNSSGFASPRCDFTTALGTLRFADGDGASKTFDILISQDSYMEPLEALTVTLSNLTGAAVFGANSTATVRIADDDVTAPVSNPIDEAGNFVRQHYHDFLNREPDQSGFDFWTNEITSCGSNQQCIDFKRVNVSAAFYLSIEFQDTGYLVERLYKSSYGDGNGNSTFNGAHQLPVPIIRFTEFLADTQEIGQGVVVGQPGWPQALENNKVAFADKFVQRARFIADFPLSMAPADFVDKLNLRAGGPLSQAERDQLVADLTSNAKTRAQVLRAVAEDQDLKNAEFNRAFVLMEYFGYLRRNPNTAQDTDYSGYDFWLTKLNQFNGNFQNSDMVKAFITAAEYRNRSGP